MRPTLAELRSWDTAAITTAGALTESFATTLDTALDAVVRAVDETTAWFGAARDALGVKVSALRDRAEEVRDVLNRIADEATDAGVDLTHARTVVLRAVEAAESDGFRVSETGVASHEDVAEYERAQTLTASIAGGLDTVAALDEDYGRRLHELQGDLLALLDGRTEVASPGGAHVDADAVVSMLSSMTPAARRRFLSGISTRDRRRLAQADPRTIGNMDGVDFDTRADANEISIRNALIDEIQAGRGGAGNPRADRLRSFLKQRNDPARASHRTGDEGRDSADDRMSERRFIAFDTSSHGHFIEMVGAIGPDTRNATIYVPGTRTSLNNSAGESNAAWELAHRTGGPVFLYLDGDLPQDLGFERLPSVLGVIGTVGIPLALRDSAADARFAREMAPRLVVFGRELDAELAGRSPGAVTTVIGHSYGGSVVGSAEQLGLRADRVIYASSAGTGVFDGPWRNPNPDVGRFSLTAPGDPIQYIQSLPGNPHGGDPDGAPGVTRLDTGYYSAHPEDSALAGTLVSGGSGHGKYWADPDSTAFTNMVRVITGESPTPYVEREPDRPAQPYLAGGRDLLTRLGLGVVDELLDRHVDLPGRLPDIPLRLRWSA
ncbi:alpha/beta hydrolase [Gordonia sp. NPDC003424]